MQTGVIIRRKAGVFIPNAYLEKALAENPHGWGATIVTDGLLQANSGDALTLEFMQETMKSFEKSDITFYLCSSPAGMNQDDLPPYTLLAKDDLPQIACYVEGNFPSYAKKDSSHPPEFFFVNEYLVPKFQGMAEMVDGDVDKIMKQIEKPHFEKELMLNVVSRGTIVLVANNGSNLKFAIGDTQGEFPWGWVSNTYGYSEKEDKPAKRSMFTPSRSTVREAAPSASIKGAVTPPLTAVSVIKDWKIEKWRPTKGMSRSQRKDGYKQRLGYLPEGWESDLEVNVYHDAKGKLMTFSEVKKLGLAAAGLPPLNNPKAKHENGETKNIEPDHVKPSNAPLVTTEILPLMSPKTREFVHDMLNRTDVRHLIAENADVIVDPSKVQMLEAKLPDFASQLGLKSMDDFLCWDFKLFSQLVDTRPDGAKAMLWTFRNIIAGSRAKAIKAEAKVEVKDKPAKRSMFAA